MAETNPAEKAETISDGHALAADTRRGSLVPDTAQTKPAAEQGTPSWLPQQYAAGLSKKHLQKLVKQREMFVQQAEALRAALVVCAGLPLNFLCARSASVRHLLQIKHRWLQVQLELTGKNPLEQEMVKEVARTKVEEKSGIPYLPVLCFAPFWHAWKSSI